MATIHLGLGSNMGDRLANLRQALAALAPHVQVCKTSRVYESRPMYLLEQPLFYNIAVEAETSFSPADLLSRLRDIERSLGRTESPRNAPRPIDIDILLYDELVLDTPELTIPHPRLHERGFVLVPLEEIARFAQHPKLQRPIVELWDELGADFDSVWPAEEQL